MPIFTWTAASLSPTMLPATTEVRSFKQGMFLADYLKGWNLEHINTMGTRFVCGVRDDSLPTLTTFCVVSMKLK